MIRVLFSCLCLGLAILPAGHASEAPGSIDYRYLDARLKLLMARDDMMGLAVAVIENGELSFSKGYGWTEKDGNPVTSHTRFRWASVSKGLAGTLAAQLEKDGLLSLDDKISAFATTLKLPAAGEKVASVKDLLAHRVGIVSNAYDNILESGREPREIRQMLGGLNLVCPVGECHGYQNVAFDTITEIMEQTTGLDYPTLVQERVFDPLGMKTASLTYEGLVESDDYAKPHSWRGGRLSRDSITRPYFRVAAAGGVSSSIEDLARYMQAQLGLFPDVFRSDALETSHRPLVETLREANGMGRRFDRIKHADYALGWRVYDYEGHKVIGHRGAVRGYRALILFDPELRTGVVALWNSGITRPTGIQFEVMDMVYDLPKRDWMRLMPDAPEG
ncbi:MAG: serine hydrolase [Ponticaulis sp.]|nr:serine hydrolase [Ponticaulis sp.]|tara:strand:- start:4949 stop:6118 length:1170 start_codon:yes stop_codon:yes gene_type:complete